jgi:hypothetical protein
MNKSSDWAEAAAKEIAERIVVKKDDHVTRPNAYYFGYASLAEIIRKHHPPIGPILSDLLPPTLWREDGEPFDLNANGMYSMRNSAMVPPYEYTIQHLLNTKAFTSSPPSNGHH